VLQQVERASEIERESERERERERERLRKVAKIEIGKTE
jgi:hypothetical protein